MASFVAIKELGPITKHLGVFYSRGSDQHGPFIEANMVDFVQGMTNDYVNLTGKPPKSASTPASGWNDAGEERWKRYPSIGISIDRW